MTAFDRKPHDDDIVMAQLAPFLTPAEVAEFENIPGWRSMTVTEFKQASRERINAMLDLYNALGRSEE